MSNLDNITKKIEDDSKKEAESIISEAEKKAQEKIDKYENEAKIEADNILNRAKRDAKSIVDKSISSAELKSRDMILLAKQDVIEKTLDKIKTKLNTMDDKSYISYLKNALSEFDESKDVELMVQKDKIKAVKKANLSLKVSDKTVDSGFSLRENNILYNNDFSSLVDSQKDELEVEIVKKLFER